MCVQTILVVLVSAALALLPAAGSDSPPAVATFASMGLPPDHRNARIANFTTFADAMGALGSVELHAFADKRMPDLRASLRPIVATLPSSNDGLLGSTAVAYSLYRFFLKRHGLLVKGLDPRGHSFNVTSPSQVVILSDAPSDVRIALMQQLSKGGLPFQDVAALAALIEFLFEHRSFRMLQAVYKVLGLTTFGKFRFQSAQRAVDLQLAAYMFGLEPQQVTRNVLWQVEARIHKFYPNWPQMQEQVHKTMNEKVPSGGAVTFAEARSVVEEIAHQFGRWQEPECMDLKHALMQLEDQDSGRVRITDFYGTAQHHGKWQFKETLPYLKQLGALDETNPGEPKVIIPNYLNGPSNCVANNRFSSVCCISECEALREHVEQSLGVPEPFVEDVARVAAALPSSTVPANRSLSPLMLNRLHRIAAANQGRVPLYGRLFAQWLHHVFPRECPYPHMSGKTRPEEAEDYKKRRKQKPTLTSAELKLRGGQAPPSLAQSSRPLVTMPWSNEEELVVPRSSTLEETPTGLFEIHATVIAAIAAIMAFRRVLLGMAKEVRQASQAGSTIVKPKHGTLAPETCAQIEV